MTRLRILTIAALMLGLTACQTTYGKVGLKTPNALAAKKIISQYCRTRQTAPTLVNPITTGDIKEDDLKVDFVSRGMDDWWRIGSSMKDVWDEVYINSRTGIMVCGYTQWKETKIKYVKNMEPFSDSLFADEIRHKKIRKP